MEDACLRYYAVGWSLNPRGYNTISTYPHNCTYFKLIFGVWKLGFCTRNNSCCWVFDLTVCRVEYHCLVLGYLCWFSFNFKNLEQVSYLRITVSPQTTFNLSCFEVNIMFFFFGCRFLPKLIHNPV